MNYETTIKTIAPFIFGFAVSFLVMSFANLSFDATTWGKPDRVFGLILGWVLGGMLFVRVNNV